MDSNSSRAATNTKTNGEKSKSPSPVPTPVPMPKKEKEEMGSASPAIAKETSGKLETKQSTVESTKSNEPSREPKVEPAEPAARTRASPAHTTTASSCSSAAPTPDPEPTPSTAAAGGDGELDTTTSYEIKWNNYASVLQNVFRKVLISHQFSDVTLACEGESIKCHRILLAACSSYFEKLLNDNQDSKLVIYMKDMKVWELKALVNFMYNGQVSVEELQLPNFMKAAEALNINGLDPSASGGGINNGVAEARTVSESASAVPAKIFSTFKRPSLSSDNSNTNSIVKKTGINTQVRPVPALQAQPRYSASGTQDTMKRKILLSNMHGGPPKLVRMQQVRSNGVNNLGMRSTTWRSVGVVKASGQNGGSSTQPFGQVVGYENEDYQDDDELDEQLDDDDSQGLQGIGEASMDSGGVQLNSNGQVENGDDDDELEDGSDLPLDENDDENNWGNGQRLGVYGLEGNQDDEQFDDDDEPPYDAEVDGEDGMMVISESSAPVIRSRSGRNYPPEVQEAAFDALRNGVSIRQCSELYGIPRKTLGKWKNRGLHLQPTSVNNAQVLGINSAIPKKRGPAVGSTLTGPEGVDRAKRLQKATKMAMSGITVRQAAAHFDIPRTTLCAYMKRQGLASQARNVNNAKAQNYFQQQQLQQRRVGATTITLSNNGTGSSYRLASNSKAAAAHDMENGMEEGDEIPFLGLSDFIDQNSENWESVN